MIKGWQAWVVGGVCVGMVGCVHAQTRIVEMPRVDQEMVGNGGYLAGSGPALQPPAKTTRQVIMTDVELPTAGEVKQGFRRFGQGIKQRMTPVKGEVGPGNRGYVVPGEMAPPAAPEPPTMPSTPVVEPSSASSDSVQETPAAPRQVTRAETAPAAPTTYVVQKGDTLEKIAKKVYGDAKRWPRIYKANKVLLKNANRVYPGQRLTIPPASSTEEAPAHHTHHRAAYGASH